MKNKKIIWILVILVLASSVYAVPIPLGLDGRVYELDGLTEVFSGFPVIINDTTSGSVKEIITGKGSSGRYSLAVNGQVGNNIIVSVSNPLFTASRNITLTGVIHDFDLVINMSLPNLAPEIISIPITNVLEDDLYTYEIDVIEWNREGVTYILSGPSGMHLDQNVVTWTPSESDVGVHNITIEVTDSVLSSTQSYVLEVINVNDPPSITSSPITKITIGKDYAYSIIAEDPDSSISYTLISGPPEMNLNGTTLSWLANESGSYDVIVQVSDGEFIDEQSFTIEVFSNSPPEIVSEPKTRTIVDRDYVYKIIAVDADGDDLAYMLVTSPDGMTLTNNVLKWDPRGFQKGTHDISVKISDGLNEVFHAFALKVVSTGQGKKGRKEGGGGSSGGIIFKQEIEEILEDFDDKTILELINKRGGRVVSKILTSRPSTIRSLNRFVYKYLEISGDPDGAEIKFQVNKNWLKGRNIEADQIVLARFAEKWNELPTENIDEDEENEIYKSETPGFSYFAITVKQGTETKLPEPVIQKIKEPFVIFGIITNNRGKEVSEGTPVVIENKDSGEIIIGQTGGPSTGAYQAVLHGSRGDQIIFTVGDEYQEEVSFALKDSKLNLNIKIPEKGFNKITGNVISFVEGNKMNLGVLAAMIALISFLIFLLKREEEEPPEKPLILDDSRGNYES